MSNNLENDRSVTTGKMYPIDLAAPQKITIVKSMSNTEVKMAHLISGQPKTTAASQIIAHTGSVGLMRTAAQVVTGVASQPQMIVSGAPILQGTQIVSQGSQLMGQNSQIISQSQLIGPSGQILSPATQIISQGTQLSAQVSNSNSTGASNTQVSVASSVSAAQVLNVGGQLSVVSSGVRTLPPSVRVLPTLPHHNNRPVLSSVNVSSAGGVLVSKGVTSHVPRGLAAGASLAVRPVTPSASQPTLAQSNNNAWSGSGRGRSALVYGGRAPMRAATPRPSTAPAPTPPPHSAIVTLPTTTVLTSSGVIASSSPAPTAPRPLPLLQRNYQPAKSHAQVVGVASVGVRGAVGNSAPPQLYYEVPRAPRPQAPYAHQATHQPVHQTTHQPTHQPTHQTVHQPTHQSSHQPAHQPTHQPVLATSHVPSHQQVHQPVLQPSHQPVHQISHQPTHQQSVNIVSTVQTLSEHRLPTTPVSNSAVLPRPSILRKREIDGSPSKNTVSAIAAGLVSVGTNLTSTLNVNNVGVGNTLNLGGISINNIGIGAVSLGGGVALGSGVTLNTVQGCAASCGWDDTRGGRGGGSGSTTESAASSPDEEPDPPPHAREPRKKPRKQMLSSEVRHCEFPPEDAPPTPPPVTVNPLPKRPLLSSGYVCGWRGTALHFARPADVRRREPRARDIVAIASQKHVLTSAEGWKVHHLTAQMDDLVLLEADVGDQLEGVLRAIESASGRALAAIQPHSHAVLELIKGNIQRSKIVCEGIQEAREDILRVFKHRNFVSDILTRQADKRCFRKHRSQS